MTRASFIPAAVLASTLALVQAASAAEPTAMQPTAEIRLWDGPSPGVPANVPPEEIVNERIRKVSVPTIRAWLPDPTVATGTAIIICPGGGYSHLAFDLHVTKAAEVFVPRGIAVIGLKYRVRPPSTDAAGDARADLQRAVRVVRARAAEWKIDPQRVGVMGYSAGANAALSTVSHPDEPSEAPDADAADKLSSRPDFAILLCTWPNGKKAAEFPIPAGAPPAFLAAVDDDKTAPVGFSKELEAAFKKAHVPIEFRTYPKGGHAGLHVGGPEAAAHWPDAMLPWLAAHGFGGRSDRNQAP